mmetsp:Transcript_15520/g.39629  ORF Transcript_15520/g.39629 Transcript_15520/m.39629 type:complete len:221 (+) Transcript_15520:178-840(+)
MCSTGEVRRAIDALFAGSLSFFHVSKSGQVFLNMLERPGMKHVFLAGSFNPLHEGHTKLLDAAHSFLELDNGRDAGLVKCFELTAVNADKPAISSEALQTRINQFQSRHDVVVTRSPTFIAKSMLFPASSWVVGYDTAVRLLNPRFYDDSTEKMHEALSSFQDRDIRFVVAGRLLDGAFMESGSLKDRIPPEYHSLFYFLPSSLFREDISSTEIRARRHV